MNDIEYIYKYKETGVPCASLFLYGNGHVLRKSSMYCNGKYELVDEFRFLKPEQGIACLEWQREYLMAKPNVEEEKGGLAQ